MHTSHWLGLTLAASLGLGSIAIQPPTTAVELSDGQVYFIQPPSLEDYETTRNTAAASGGTYYFTISIPENAGEPLQRVSIVQEDGDSFTRRVRFEADETRAFVGTTSRRGDALPLSNVTYDRDTQTVVVEFAPPVEPGTTVTIGLRPERNPRNGGVYLFGVTAFPQGEMPHGQFLGYGRFQIYERGDGVFPFSYRDRFW